jgi:UPF0755 protein
MIRHLIPKRHKDRAGVLVLTGFFFLLWLAITPPTDFPIGKVAVVDDGATVASAAATLKADHVIRSSFLFSLLIRALGGSVIAGGYVFEHPPLLMQVAWQMSRGGNAPEVKVTIPEGATVKEIKNILAASLPDFDSATFMDIASNDEGYLFPETYFFTPGTSPQTVVTAMRHTFDTRVVPLGSTIASSSHSLGDIVRMASILEKEARPNDQAIIAGILWKRLDIGMRLQVDADPATYDHLGLPPGPIDNPGFAALKAALEPVKTPYLYYLTGADGTMHYAKTFAEHTANRKYLR